MALSVLSVAVELLKTLIESEEVLLANHLHHIVQYHSELFWPSVAVVFCLQEVEAIEGGGSAQEHL